ncbi:MAG: hypothetical protein WCY97_07375 [Methanothrix sp.]|jgi:hypothetical protein|uniref:Uncharacterized protein n=1 Tax=Methanothrix harundinacea TaxID=301375 RepID=A0A101FTL0_9EURY|nr:MAG: hypothetical protein XD72_1491 [Methanothrix harundinacea]MDD2638374.1 hypothetical protein [Methanothrix sp.]MDI9397986.1 hypothetical protein [Euryarchaeota archaeon]KUK97319.1 MAG: hypothetical protein XE07_0474 [Methanothrix harundinacea]MCP1392752.1 hypothetical protein [Methanothrix harundinacea]
MVEASGYIFQDVEALLKRAKELMEEAKEGAKEEAKIKTPELGVGGRCRESLNGSMQKLDEISSRYRDDAEVSLMTRKLGEYLEDLDSGKLTPEIKVQRLDRIIEEVHHLVEWRRLSTAAARDLSLKSRRRTRDDFKKR